MTNRSPLSPTETTELLQRILAAVDKSQRRPWVEITGAIVLSLATTASAWCAYQSTLWGGVQTFRLAAANKHGRDASAHTIESVQLRAFDASMLISYLEARNRGEQSTAQFLLGRFRPEMKVAVDAWLATDPFTNADAPTSPFLMPEYKQKALADAEQDEARSQQYREEAQQANQTSDTYVLLTVMFASVLFFGGIGATFESQRLRIALTLIAWAFFFLTMTFLLTMPICRE